MAFMSISAIAENEKGKKNYRRGPITANRKYLVIGSNSGGKDKYGTERTAIVCRISAPLAKEARIIHGDRVDLLIDKESGLGLLRRISSGGYAATATGKPLKEIKQGEYYGITVKITYYAGMPKFGSTTECDNVNVSDEGILFDLPKDATYQ